MGDTNPVNPSVWLTTEPATPRWAAAPADLDADVCVVGGGITGMTTALLLQESGASVVVIESDTIASGTTGSTTAKVTSLHGLVYARLLDEQGEERARQYADANEAAIATVAGLVDRLGIDCQLERRQAFTFTADQGRVDDIAAEVEAAQRLGLPASFTSELEPPFAAAGAVRFDGQAQLHPRRYVLGLAQAFVAAGGRLVEQQRAVAVDEDGDRVTVRLEGGGTVRAGTAVLATLLPISDAGAFFAKAHPYRSYALAVRLREGAPPAGMYYSVDSPTRSSRALRFDDGAEGLVLGGNGHKTGQEADTEAQYADLEAWAREVFDVAAVEARWSAQDYVPVDGVPYVGRSPRTSRTYVATGFKKWGMTNGTAAAMILAAELGGERSAWADVFDATRIDPGPSLKAFVKENLDVGKRFVQDHVRRLRAPDAHALAPGEGGLVEVDGEHVAAYRHPDGRLTAVSGKCTHLGCTVLWNPAETSWDCPCHGSRFTCEGRVIAGPAVEPLAPVEIDQEA
jgi:glycine/D-amino acid oxidase-like deaminating enzyme/nitrite reductase/ring-hydroxylating ferredoxin subunit